MAEIIPFSRKPGSVDELLRSVHHLGEDGSFSILRGHVATCFAEAASPELASALVNDAILHLKGASSGQITGGVEVSVAGLHLVLAYIEYLEGRLGIIPPPGAA